MTDNTRKIIYLDYTQGNNKKCNMKQVTDVLHITYS